MTIQTVPRPQVVSAQSFLSASCFSAMNDLALWVYYMPSRVLLCVLSAFRRRKFLYFPSAKSQRTCYYFFQLKSQYSLNPISLQLLPYFFCSSHSRITSKNFLYFPALALLALLSLKPSCLGICSILLGNLLLSRSPVTSLNKSTLSFFVLCLAYSIET